MVQRMPGSIVICLVVALAGVPSVASAHETTVMTRRVRTVTGADVALDALRGLDGIEVGSGGATVTIDAGGVSRSIPIRMSALTGHDRDPYAMVALFAFIGSAITRLAAVLSRLSR